MPSRTFISKEERQTSGQGNIDKIFFSEVIQQVISNTNSTPVYKSETPHAMRCKVTDSIFVA